MLHRSHILVVEDEPFIALMLQALIEDAGGVVVGPVATSSSALALVQSCAIAAAILDVHLSDRDVEPVAEALASRGVPMVFHTSENLPPHLQNRFPDATVCLKPISLEVLLSKVRKLVDQNFRAR
jgi:CheY-like chemotaxis protein